MHAHLPEQHANIHECRENMQVASVVSEPKSELNSYRKSKLHLPIAIVHVQSQNIHVLEIIL